MKKFLVFAAMFAAMFLIMSCGGSGITGDGYYTDGDTVCSDYSDSGDCKGHDVRACAEGDDYWYEVEGTGKKFKCDDGDCTKAAFELNNYCYDTNIDYNEEDGATCVTTEEPDTCGGKAVKFCTKDESYWYEVDGKKYECKDAGSEECTQAMMDFSTYCAKAEEEAEEDGESGFATEPTAYLPQSHAGKIVEAWYMLKEKDDDKIKIEAVFLFQDFSLVVTSAKVYSIADGRDPEDEIIAEGTFEITSGSYNDGSASVDTGEAQFDVTITNGVLSAMGEEFIKQDNGYAPEPR
jgi:hypothetical protein